MIFAVALAALAAFRAFADAVDARMREYVEPVRVVWTTPRAEGFGERFKIEGAEELVGGIWERGLPPAMSRARCPRSDKCPSPGLG